ncbi:ectoine/hydroxyectoine ABC transporter permease subunit EhuC [Halobacillus naozhouensis]|uniref:Ectoine/hydroxyectoine ABC transporter permease subunit EhuC n=1 Tax=Halobacillus naozhouensis TaxID=554880 RepID=A0ABY8J7Z6_9BACI|nr:ectoine/hydroxyectoine ABC transporter permease subunit EhuC [Halobacillus naozhouensis]WFT76865.1 ectoine/hydroxyectoine ABC transporter permease subunit EhuC [Halobacillus naozhouensis]
MNNYVEIIPILLEGLDITITVLIGSAIFGYLIAFLAGFGRLSKNFLIRNFTKVYIEVFRGTSLVVQLFWFFYVLPGLLGIELSAYLIGVITIGMNYGAYMSEVVRGSILAVSSGQSEAATALNMSRFQRMRFVILPQAIRMMLPEFGNYLIQMLKATSLVSIISLADITYVGLLYRDANISEGVAVFTMLLVLYFIIALPLIGLTRWLERWASKGVATE